MVCLICQDTVAVYKISNVKRRNETHHEKNYHNFVGKPRVKEAERLKKELKKQSSFFTRKVNESILNTRASYEVSKLIAEKVKPFCDEEFFNGCMLKVVDVVCPQKKRFIFRDQPISKDCYAVN